MFRRSPTSSFALLLFFTLIGGPPAAAATVVAHVGDASVTRDSAEGTWTLSAGGAALTIAADPSRDFVVASLVSPSGQNWAIGPASDTFVRAAGRTLAFGHRASGFEDQGTTVAERAPAADIGKIGRARQKLPIVLPSWNGEVLSKESAR
jgi:hypothetical protein